MLTPRVGSGRFLAPVMHARLSKRHEEKIKELLDLQEKWKPTPALT